MEYLASVNTKNQIFIDFRQHITYGGFHMLTKRLAEFVINTQAVPTPAMSAAAPGLRPWPEIHLPNADRDGLP